MIYDKWLKNIASDPLQESELSTSAAADGVLVRVCMFLLQPKPGVGKGEVVTYGIIWLLLLVWGWQFLAMDFQSAQIMYSWMHNVDLIFHEAGHVLFMPFGQFMMYLGGSLFQVLLPLIFVFAFLFANKDAFAASACLWWVGQSLMDLAPYIADARALRLPLLGGGTGADSPGRHDWRNILRPIGQLENDIAIAGAVDLIGSGILLISLVWGAVMLRVYYRSSME